MLSSAKIIASVFEDQLMKHIALNACM